MRVIGAHLLAFALELGLIFAFARSGYGLAEGRWTGWALALLFAAVAIALWARFAAPKAPTRLSGQALLGFKAAIFAAGVVAFAGLGWPLVALGFAGLVLVHFALSARLGVL
jgi:hypothetical protein